MAWQISRCDERPVEALVRCAPGITRMLRPLSLASLALTAVGASTAAAPAAACSEVIELMPFGPTFANRTIPLNAELWVLYPRLGGTSAYVFVAPDGSEQRVEIEASDDDALLITEVALVPGAWQMIDVDRGESWSFDVSDTVDDAPPPPPAVEVETFTQGSPLAIFFGCGDTTPESRQRFTITVDPAEVGQVTVAGRRYLVDGEFLTIVTADDGAYAFTTIDHAGNESEPVTLGASGGGCASTPTSSLSLLAVVLLVRRRRNA